MRGQCPDAHSFQVLTHFEIGRCIVEHEQKGEKRAAYGTELLKELSARLAEEFGSGFSLTNLKLMRQFFVEYRLRIGQTASDQSSQHHPIGQTASGQWPSNRKQQTVPGGLVPAQISETLSRKSPFTLSWSHYVE
jgi:hypothetical protein